MVCSYLLAIEEQLIFKINAFQKKKGKINQHNVRFELLFRVQSLDEDF